MSLKGVTSTAIHAPASLPRDDALSPPSTTQELEKRPPGPLASMALAGTTALIAVNLTHPIEIIKVRMQTEGKFQAGAFLRNEGVLALFKGIQVSGSTPRRCRCRFHRRGHVAPLSAPNRTRARRCRPFRLHGCEKFRTRR
mmetsp:Transcript_23027/g.41170  ORF Transcript_23027/g.41170 Transcript_23027/m.41170 type:complete len:141 (+) Transcript_23027:75-497(+)